MPLALYLTIVYITLLTFLDGYAYIFQQPCHLFQGLTNIIWLKMLVDVLCNARRRHDTALPPTFSAQDPAVCDDGRLGAGLQGHFTVFCQGQAHGGWRPVIWKWRRPLDTEDPRVS